MHSNQGSLINLPKAKVLEYAVEDACFKFLSCKCMLSLLHRTTRRHTSLCLKEIS